MATTGPERAQSGGSARWIRWAALAGVVILAGVAGWLVYSAVRANQAAMRLQASASESVAAAQGGDLGGLVQAARAMDDAAGELLSATDPAPWRLIERVPGVGDRIVAGRAVAQAAIALTSSGEPLLGTLSVLQSKGVRTADGRIDVAAISALAPLLGNAAVGAQRAEEILAGSPAVAGEEGAAVAEARDRLPALAARLAQAADAVPHLADALGANGPRRWAILLQNTSEMRGSGGLIGAYAIVTADDGRVSIDEAAARKNGLDGTPIPYAEVADDSQIATWGEDLSRWSDFNLSLDFPFVGRLAAAGMAARGNPVDGVMALDARIVAAILAGTGPVTVGDVTIESGSAEEFFTAAIYQQIPDVAAKDNATVLLLQATVQAALSGDLDYAALVGALMEPVRTEHLKVWSADPGQERWLASLPVGGVLPDEPGPFVGVALNNSAGSKLDHYVSLAADYAVGTCPAGTDSASTLALTLANDAPAGLPDYVVTRLDDTAAPRGSTSLLVSIYAPIGALVEQSTVNGQEAMMARGHERGHPVWTLRVGLDPGERARIRVEFSEPAVDGAQPRLWLPLLFRAPAAHSSLDAASSDRCAA